MSASGGGVAWFAHIGGFIAGLALIKLFERTKKTTIRQSESYLPPEFDDFD